MGRQGQAERDTTKGSPARGDKGIHLPSERIQSWVSAFAASCALLRPPPPPHKESSGSQSCRSGGACREEEAESKGRDSAIQRTSKSKALAEQHSRLQLRNAPAVMAGSQ